MKTRKEFEEVLLERAMKDESFRKRLMENPKKAVEEEFGIKLPDDITLNVREENPDEVFLILPKAGEALPSDDLSDEELNGLAAAGDTLTATLNRECLLRELSIYKCVNH